MSNEKHDNCPGPDNIHEIHAVIRYWALAKTVGDTYDAIRSHVKNILKHAQDIENLDEDGSLVEAIASVRNNATAMADLLGEPLVGEGEGDG